MLRTGGAAAGTKNCDCTPDVGVGAPPAYSDGSDVETYPLYGFVVLLAVGEPG